MFLERVTPSLNSAIRDAESALAETMPDSVRAGLEGELRRLKAAQSALLDEEKSLLHEMRAKLRWGRNHLTKEHDPAKKKALEKELKALETQIAREAAFRSNKA